METRHLLNDWANFGTSSRVKTRFPRDSDSDKSKDIHVQRGKDEATTTELPSHDNKSKHENSEKHRSHMKANHYPDATVGIRTEHHIRNVENRYICFSPSYCQNITSYHIAPSNTFSCTNKNLEIIIDAKFIEPAQDVEGLFMLETIRQAIAYMPSIGELQRQQESNEECLPIKK